MRLNPIRCVLSLASIAGALVSLPAGAICTGSPIGGKIFEVTEQLSMVATGVSVTQISETGGNWISYYDIPLYSTVARRLFYNSDHGNAKFMAQPDGSLPEQISSDAAYRNTHTRPVFVSYDGRFTYFARTNPDDDGVDLYLIRLTDTGPCREQRLTRLAMDPNRTVQVSTSSFDSAEGKSVIAFANGAVMHRVVEDGTMLADVHLPDGENEQDFHRIRMNPKFPNLVFYRRNAHRSHDNTKSLYIVDLNSPDKAYDVADQFGQIIHPLWSPDGMQLGFKAEDKQWHVLDVARPNGSLNLEHGRFPGRAVGPKRDARLNVQFCSWAPDGSKYVCITQEVGADNKIFLMSTDGQAILPLVSTDTREKTGKAIQGDTWAQFVQDDRHIAFHSTRTGVSELYVIDCAICESF